MARRPFDSLPTGLGIQAATGWNGGIAYDDLKKVYRGASGAVHTGSVKSHGAELLKKGQEICRQAIMKRLRSKQKPVWRDIVFGR